MKILNPIILYKCMILIILSQFGYAETKINQIHLTCETTDGEKYEFSIQMLRDTPMVKINGAVLSGGWIDNQGSKLRFGGRNKSSFAKWHIDHDLSTKFVRITKIDTKKIGVCRQNMGGNE